MVHKIVAKKYTLYYLCKGKRYVDRAIFLKEIFSVKFYNILSTYNAKIKIILYTFLKFDNKN